MSNELQNVLDEIKLEKDSKLLPENIKKGVQIFDITGTLEQGGASTDVPVKLFETIEEMNADSTAQEGDLAVVYRSEIQNMTADMEVTAITFPETVTLPAAFTGSANGSLRAVDSSVMFDGYCDLNKTSFRFDGWSESGMIRVEYTSTDGITYTRTRFQGDSGDLTNPVEVPACKVEQQEEWNDNFGYFIQIGGMYFEGLFMYNANYINKSRCRLFHKDDVTVSTDTDKLIRIGNNARYVDYDMLTLRNIFVQMEADGISGSNNVLYVKDGDLYVLKGATDRFNRLWLDSSTDKLTGFAPDAYGDMTSSAAYIYKLNVNDTNTPYELVETVYPTIAINNDNSNNRYSIILRDYDYCGLIFYSSENYSVSIPKTSYTIDTSLKTDSDYDASSIEHTEIPYKVEAIYLTANSQLNLTNADELLPGKIAYGKNGVVTADGSIYNNLDITKVLTDIHKLPESTIDSYKVYGPIDNTGINSTDIGKLMLIKNTDTYTGKGIITVDTNLRDSIRNLIDTDTYTVSKIIINKSYSYAVVFYYTDSSNVILGIVDVNNMSLISSIPTNYHYMTEYNAGFIKDKYLIFSPRQSQQYCQGVYYIDVTSSSPSIIELSTSGGFTYQYHGSFQIFSEDIAVLYMYTEGGQATTHIPIEIFTVNENDEFIKLNYTLPECQSTFVKTIFEINNAYYLIATGYESDGNTSHWAFLKIENGIVSKLSDAKMTAITNITYPRCK